MPDGQPSREPHRQNSAVRNELQSYATAAPFNERTKRATRAHLRCDLSLNLRKRYTMKKETLYKVAQVALRASFAQLFLLPASCAASI